METQVLGARYVARKPNSQAWERHANGSKYLIELRLNLFGGKDLTFKMISLRQSFDPLTS